MNKILIVGGAGYIGGYLTDQLSKNYDVTVFDNLMYEDRYLKDVKFIHGNILQEKNLKAIINDYDCVIWLAAIVGDGACTVDPYLTNRINYECLKWIPEVYKGKFIFMSTCSVYGLNNNLLDEDSEPNPLSTYAITKLQAEKYIRKNIKNHLIFRLGTLFGVSDKFSRIRLDLVANVLTHKAASKEALSVFGGEQWRPLLHVKDVTTATEHGIKNNITGLYNLSYENFTIKDIALNIKKIIPNTEIAYQDMPFEDLRNYKVKNDKYLRTGWKPKYNLDIGILEMNKIFIEKRITDPSNPIYHNHFYLKSIWSK